MPFLWKNLRNFGKRIFYRYFLRDVNFGSLELVVGMPGNGDDRVHEAIAAEVVEGGIPGGEGDDQPQAGQAVRGGAGGRGRIVGGPRQGHRQPLGAQVLGEHVDDTGIPSEHGHPRVGTSLLHRREARRAGHGRRSALA